MTELEKAARRALEALDSLLDVAMVPMTCEGLCSAESVDKWHDFSFRRDALRSTLTQALATTELDEDDDKWRDVALRFDKHRMQALWHLQAMLKDPEKHADIVRQFLKDPTHPAAATAERVPNRCAQCKKECRQNATSIGCPKCAPGVSVSEDEFQKPIATAELVPVLQQATLSDYELPGMWSTSDLIGGETDTQPATTEPEAASPADMQVYNKIAAGYWTERKGPLSKDQIREVFLAHGFTVKDGQTDLKTYVYDAAYALIALVQQPTERKGEPVVPTDLGAWLWVKLADYCRRKGLNPHHENDLFNLAGELRAMLAHTSPQVPEDVIVILDECRTALMECDRDCDYELIDRAYAAIDAARKGE